MTVARPNRGGVSHSHLTLAVYALHAYDVSFAYCDISNLPFVVRMRSWLRCSHALVHAWEFSWAIVSSTSVVVNFLPWPKNGGMLRVTPLWDNNSLISTPLSAIILSPFSIRKSHTPPWSLPSLTLLPRSFSTNDITPWQYSYKSFIGVWNLEWINGPYAHLQTPAFVKNSAQICRRLPTLDKHDFFHPTRYEMLLHRRTGPVNDTPT